MQIALVHDFLVRMGGAERVLAEFAKMYPKAPIFTILYDEKLAGSTFPRERVITSGLQKLPSFIKKRHKYLFPLMPAQVEQFDLSGYDLVISSSNAYAHGVVTNLRTKHICYCHSPMRYAWDWTHNYMGEQRLNGVAKMFAMKRLEQVRMWDMAAADRVDKYIANSRTVAGRIQKYYRQDSEVIYPPVDVRRFSPKKTNENYFLIVSTLTPYKKIDLAISMFNRLGRRLVIIGDGSARGYLERMAGPSIDFLGFKSDAVIKDYMENCRGVLFPGEDDFGIVPVEAMACGKPVLAYGRGGATETVIPGVTGEFFYEPTFESIEDGLARLLLNEPNYQYMKIRKHALEFDREVFVEKFKRELGKLKK
ncbi:MAG: glycosyl transferase group 1 [uncultured bacterium]|nr:MAG: glycosyl transferase group 1 [uncultured bacterium]OGJ47860.1 MAG: hypothetical protein A2244_05270 [Candidatus Peregrinibacteria bacterium RIFOXYA2_FULL_41_18]OGJ48916.1 MAG: hypothetical protein A2344_02780 [Candidatus Peregrinibacteria bacterium RIFOXYB12_FULL_41_12]OGJ55274.1 MAG: hypothetical protein A2336_01785 [Candidatus Peregrinibacteria bacterium RIFOXYB2_FULL_41_88]